VPVGEAAVSLSGMQGMRLYSRLQAALKREGCDILHLPVTRLSLSRSGTQVELPHGRTLRAGGIVLATGKYMGGGVRIESGRPSESTGSLPLWQDGKVPLLPSSSYGFDPLNAFGTDLIEGGPGFRRGVGYDEAFRVLDERGAPVADDLFAAGALLDGF